MNIMEIQSFSSGMQAQFQLRQEQKCIIFMWRFQIAVVHLALNKTLFSCLDINFKHANSIHPDVRKISVPSNHLYKYVAFSRTRKLKTFDIVQYIYSAALSTIETSLVVRLWFCAIACARKERFAQCEILLDIALATQEVGL